MIYYSKLIADTSPNPEIQINRMKLNETPNRHVYMYDSVIYEINFL